MNITNSMNHKRIDIRTRLDRTYQMKTTIHPNDIRDVLKKKWKQTFDVNLYNQDGNLFFDISCHAPKDYKVFSKKLNSIVLRLNKLEVGQMLLEKIQAEKEPPCVTEDNEEQEISISLDIPYGRRKEFCI